MYVLYMDDSILAGPNQNELDDIIAKMEQTGLKMTYDNGIEDFLGVHVDRKEDGSIHLTQPHLIQSILDDLHFDGSVTHKVTPAPVTVPLRMFDKAATPFDHHFHFRSVIGKLNFLEQSTRPDCSYAIHQCARFATAPKEPHAKAVKHVGRYLAGTKEKGNTLRPNPQRGFEVYADADFCGHFNKLDARDS